MANINPFQMISLLKNNNPQAVAEEIVHNNFPNDPTLNNLVQLAERGDTNSVNQFAQQFFNSRGMDFKTEMNDFMSMMNQL